MTDLHIPAAGRDLAVYVGEPAGDESAGGVVVIHDAMGLTSDLRHHVDWLAGAGFLAAGPDLFAGGRRLACIRSVMSDIKAGQGRSFEEIEAVRSWLLAHGRSNGRVGVIGFCMGGGFALVLAPGRGFDASSVNYGAAPKKAYTADFLRGSCPIVGSFGGRDVTLRGAAGRLEGALTEAGVEHDVKEYPEAGHSFLDQHDPDDVPRLFTLAAKLPFMGYHEPSAADARERIAAFFERHLGAGDRTPEWRRRP